MSSNFWPRKNDQPVNDGWFDENDPSHLADREVALNLEYYPVMHNRRFYNPMWPWLQHMKAAVNWICMNIKRQPKHRTISMQMLHNQLESMGFDSPGPEKLNPYMSHIKGMVKINCREYQLASKSWALYCHGEDLARTINTEDLRMARFVQDEDNWNRLLNIRETVKNHGLERFKRNVNGE